MFIKLFALTFVVFLILDFIWLRILMRKFYFQEFSPIARRNSRALTPYFPTALIGYIVVMAGFVHFVILPQLGQPIGWNTFLEGAFFALCVNIFFECLGHALIDKWPWRMLIVDNFWGFLVGGLTTVITLFLASKLGWTV